MSDGTKETGNDLHFPFRTVLFFFSFSVLAGNVIGAMEVYLIRFHIPYLPEVSGIPLLEYFFGGAFLYGILIGIPLFIFILFVFGITKLMSFNFSESRSPLLFLAIMIFVLIFYSGAKYFYFDFPGLIEAIRHVELIAIGIVTASLVCLLGHYFQPLTQLSTLVWRFSYPIYLSIAIVSLNIILLAFGGSKLLITGKHSQVSHSNNCKGPPVILIGIDTLRADHLNSYNTNLPYNTPATNLLASKGVVYERNHSQWGGTAPSFASMFTSRFPREIPVTENGEGIPEDELTLVEILRNEGYKTHAVVDSPFLHEKYFGQGFQSYQNNEDYGLWNMKVARYANQLFGRYPQIESSIEWIRNQNTDCFFLFLHNFIPHDPYHPPFPYSLQFDPFYIGKASGDYDALHAVRNEQAFHAESDIRHIKNLYKGEVRFAEQQLRKILNTLKRQKLFRKSLIVFTADHGEMMTEQDVSEWFSHGSYYQTDIRVPLIIKYPGNEYAGERYDGLTANLDIYPTILQVLDDPTENKIRGRSVHPPNSISDTRTIFSQEDGVEVLLHGPWKAIYREKSDSLELYNIKHDPYEQNEISEKHKNLSQKFKGILKAHYERTSMEKLIDSEPTARERKMLEGLGYIE